MSPTMFLNTRLVIKEDFWAAFRELEAIYFIRDRKNDCIKIGHSNDPWRRLTTLQVGCNSELDLIGVIAAEIRIERIVYFQLIEGRVRGEWVWDRGVTSQWLADMTHGEPMCRNVWRLV